MRYDLALELMGAALAMRPAGSSAAGPGGVQTQRRPDGTVVTRITSMDGLKALLPRRRK